MASSDPDPQPVNKAGMVPRNPGDSTSSVDYFASPPFESTVSPPGPTLRSRFLDGTWPCLFMPGQDGSGVLISQPYVAPTAWPASGSVLRVPKFVYLTSNPPPRLWGANFQLVSCWSPNGYYGHYFDAVARDTRTGTPGYAAPTVNGEGSLVSDLFTGGYNFIGWMIDPQNIASQIGPRKWYVHRVVENAIYVEHNRLIGEFQAAKATLEAKYPNEVFVEITGFFPPEPVVAVTSGDYTQQNVLDIVTDDGAEANTPTHRCAGPNWILGANEYTDPEWVNDNPDASTGYPCQFFGSNFLHIYCGYQSFQCSLPTRETFATEGFPPAASVQDHLDRTFWDNKTFGFPLTYPDNPNIEFVPLPTVASTVDGYGFVCHDYDAYETGATQDGYARYEADIQSVMTSDTTPGQGKLDLLNNSLRNFPAWRVSLHEYDCSWDFGSAVTTFPSGPGGDPTNYPPSTIDYMGQSWVEGYEYPAGYATAKAAVAGNPEYYYTDVHATGLPWYDPTETIGIPYNFTERFPQSVQWTGSGGWNSQLATQWTNFSNAMTHAGPKTVDIWNDLIANNSLSADNFSYDGGSSVVDADYIVAYVESYYGLTPPVG